jgi:metal-responsive CopG/Arc/MetJ family transcriptional regulator
MAEPLDQRLQLVISKGQVREIDEWRRLQPDLPSRSEAIRRLIEAGLEAQRSKRPSKGGVAKA